MPGAGTAYACLGLRILTSHQLLPDWEMRLVRGLQGSATRSAEIKPIVKRVDADAAKPTDLHELSRTAGSQPGWLTSKAAMTTGA